ncbi:MAG: hypothetical protein CMQ75_01545 [Gammaproteobacteria bacterium]|nr:hypothetical protein [Gammaproteobacteria bacterium]RPG99478.1 MAG: hypothetical protein CBC78_001745 [Candidatus Pelagibacter sp. TMED118]|tara:strand:- start:609 stop:911 length:303 start_codon:yes stop_codon:yes gene_type:complete
MAVEHTYTAKKSGSSFTSTAEVKADMRAICNDSAYFTYIDATIAAGNLTLDESFDASTQTYTVKRTWDDATHTSWKSSPPGNWSSHVTDLEAAGYTITIS